MHARLIGRMHGQSVKIQEFFYQTNFMWKHFGKSIYTHNLWDLNIHTNLKILQHKSQFRASKIAQIVAFLLSGNLSKSWFHVKSE